MSFGKRGLLVLFTVFVMALFAIIPTVRPTAVAVGLDAPEVAAKIAGAASVSTQVQVESYANVEFVDRLEGDALRKAAIGDPWKTTPTGTEVARQFSLR
jgi:hypothetical protein